MPVLKNSTNIFIYHLLVFDDIVGMGIGKSKKEAEPWFVIDKRINGDMGYEYLLKIIKL